MGFQNDVIVRRDINKDHLWVLEEDVVYENKMICITIKKSFDFDFASTPNLPIISWLFPKSGTQTDRASLLHDALFASQALPRIDCDNLFLEAMEVDGVNYLKRYAMYYAVSLFGEKVYNDTEDLEHYKKLVKVVRK